MGYPLANASSNINPETQVRYGITSSNNHPELTYEIMTNGDDLSYQYFVSEAISYLDNIPLDGYEEEITAAIKEILDHLHSCQITAQELLDLAIASQYRTDVSSGEAIWEQISDRVEYESTDSSYQWTTEDFDLLYDGGNIWIFKSPTVVYINALCSPCMPNAGNLDSGFSDSPDDGYECYGIPEGMEG